MTVFVDHREANYTEDAHADGNIQRQYDYFGKTSPNQFGPEAFFVDYGPERTTSAHFHSIDQFQIFFGGKGSLYQRHPIPAVELHYADAFHTYGPFSAGEGRMQFFTLRPCQGQYKGNMPAERHKLRYQGKRGIHLALDPYLAATPGSGKVDTTAVIAREHDGLAATLFMAGDGAEITLPSAEASSGSYICVLAGEITVGDRTVGPRSLGWMPPGSKATTVRAAGSGTTSVLCMTYPYPPTPEAHGGAVTAG